jgi:hypothetical protein
MLLLCSYYSFAHLVLACIKMVMVGPVVLELEVKRQKRQSLSVDVVDDCGHNRRLPIYQRNEVIGCLAVAMRYYSQTAR